MNEDHPAAPNSLPFAAPVASAVSVCRRRVDLCKATTIAYGKPLEGPEVAISAEPACVRGGLAPHRPGIRWHLVDPRCRSSYPHRHPAGRGQRRYRPVSRRSCLRQGYPGRAEGAAPLWRDPTRRNGSARSLGSGLRQHAASDPGSVPPAWCPPKSSVSARPSLGEAIRGSAPGRGGARPCSRPAVPGRSAVAVRRSPGFCLPQAREARLPRGTQAQHGTRCD